MASPTLCQLLNDSAAGDRTPAEIAARLAAMRAKATIIPGYVYCPFVAAHPAV